MAEAGRTVGRAKCPHCGHDVAVKANKKGHLYVYCDTPADGGCGIGAQSRSDVGDGRIAAIVHRWSDAEAKKAYTALIPGHVKPVGETSDKDIVVDPPADDPPPAAPLPDVPAKSKSIMQRILGDEEEGWCL